ncbi:hypothetical protein V490_07975 [Pseudogymnoascus sp. VKM F-3557]|nr:hypothetical protein V490_07975 [Pseudogymnoascus sp. VKM F-3557]
MIREQIAPSGPRPAGLPSQKSSKENHDPVASAPRQRLPIGREPPPVLNKIPLPSFGGNNPEEQASGEPLDFLPSPSFDDLHQSISSASDDQRLEPFPDASRESSLSGSMISERSTGGVLTRDAVEAKGLAGRGAPISRPVRSGSLLRRQSTSNRQSSVSSTSSNIPGSMDPPTAPLAMRTRRQNQYPPISANNGGKGQRKSIGFGSTESDSSFRTSHRRRPSLASSITASASNQSLSEAANSSRMSDSSGNFQGDTSRLTTPRASKTKSLQPPSRHNPESVSTPRGTPDHSRSLSYAGKSPGRQNGRNTSTPSSTASRRMSQMPSSNSHASGLGARTISPTDTRRMKRMSTMHGAPPLPNTPPVNQQDPSHIRGSSRSPSLLPRMSTTPSSLRNTPDFSRKTYGVSTGSNGGFTPRSSTGSLQPQPRLLPVPSTSRLPTPKTRNVHSSAGNEEEEVPPVPAIPKAYESPKESPSEAPMFAARKSSLPFDSSSINSRNSSSTNELSGTSSGRDPRNVDSSSNSRIRHGMGAGSDAEQHGKRAPPKKKHLQPLRLPPLNLLPLSTPTAAKIAQFRNDATAASNSNGTVTPPPKRANAKTPTTPMTASKSSFFSHHRDDMSGHITDQMRSSTSIQHSRQDNGSISPTKPLPAPPNPARQNAVSPFISSSLPKNSGEFNFLPRPQTSGDFPTDFSGEQRLSKLNGPRALNTAMPPKSSDDVQTYDQSSQDEAQTPSSASSLRRKLSLGWRRTASKSSISLSHAASERAANDKSSEYAPQPPKHDPKHNDMPPPRLPASVSMQNVNSQATATSPSPTVKPLYLESKRRKSSISSLTTLPVAQDRTQSNNWGITRSAKKEDTTTDVKPMQPKLNPQRSSASMIAHGQRIIGPKASTTNLRPVNPYAAKLDKDDLVAEEEMKKMASRRKETEQAAKVLDALRKRATPKERVSPQQAVQMAHLNIYERGEIVDFKDVYFCGTQNAAKHVGKVQSDNANFGYDDERGDYTIVKGDHLSFRYEIIDILGKGSFGQVVRCIDHKTGGLVAIKIIRNKKRFHQQALVEVNILQKLREWDPTNRHSMVNFTQSFYFRGHLCLSTELLDMNLYEFIKYNGFKGFSLKLIRRFTKQLLGSLLLLKMHKVIHCDLKPENILLAHPMHSEIKVIDFGSSCFENEKVYTYIQSRFYRSPEVILGMSYGIAIDMWSVGCILAELYTGYPIFPGENEQEQLACIMEVFGPPEKHLIEKSTRKKLFFDSMGKPRLIVSSKGRRRKPSSKTLQQVLKCDDEVFLDFLSKCLRWDPARRMTPDQAVQHEYILGPKSSLSAPRPIGGSSRNESPVKRYNNTTSSQGSQRPLPEPPVTALRTAGTRTRDPSPSKAPAPRRLSNVHNLSNPTISTASKRASIGPGAQTTSGLPRVTTRSTSGRQDLAISGAGAAMNRRG